MIYITGKYSHKLSEHEVEVIMFKHLKLPIEAGAWLNAVLESLVGNGYVHATTGSLTEKARDWIGGYYNLNIQERITIWSKVCFVKTGIEDKMERAYRFGEEALELMQASGISEEDLHKLVHYVYNRPQGDQGQEVGGTFTTLAVLCSVNTMDMMECAMVELDRIWRRIPEIRKKQENKPKASPLQGPVEVETADTTIGIDAAGGMSISTKGDVTFTGKGVAIR